MNHGNTNRSNDNLDEFIERLNKKIAKLLGKQDKQPPTGKTTNLAFALIILLFSLVVWLLTGFYYLGENQYGLVLTDGRITKVVKGLRVGFTLPYPFGGIEVLNAGVSDLLTVGTASDNASNYMVLTKDLFPIAVEAKLAYQITDPKTLYLNYLQQTDNLNNIVQWQLEQQLHNYIAQKTSSELSKINLTIMANQLREQANGALSKYGVDIVKLAVTSLQQVAQARTTTSLQVTKPQLVATVKPTIADQLLQQALSYQQDKVTQAKANVEKFKQLLPQYEANPQELVQQLYDNLLASVPVTKADKYPLLKLSLAELMTFSPRKENIFGQVNDSGWKRDLDRKVVRSRTLNGR
ncbi:MAG: SPFH domain-containing protein [Burkholderiales bacterium]